MAREGLIAKRMGNQRLNRRPPKVEWCFSFKEALMPTGLLDRLKFWRFGMKSGSYYRLKLIVGNCPDCIAKVSRQSSTTVALEASFKQVSVDPKRNRRNEIKILTYVCVVVVSRFAVLGYVVDADEADLCGAAAIATRLIMDGDVADDSGKLVQILLREMVACPAVVIVTAACLCGQHAFCHGYNLACSEKNAKVFSGAPSIR